MADGRSDGELVLAAGGGDQTAWNVLVRRLTPRMMAVGRGLGLSIADASDVCQVAWFRLWDRLADLREPERVGAWLVTTVRRESLNHLRMAGRQVPSAGDNDEFETDAAPQPDVDADLLRNERERALWKAFAQLPARCQRLLRLMMSDPPATYDEVRAALGMPVGSIGPTRNRCLKLLRERLGGIKGS